MNTFEIGGWNYLVSEKLKNSIVNRVYELASGRVIVPADIIKRIHNENVDNVLIDSFNSVENQQIKSFCIEIYSGAEIKRVIKDED